MYSQDSRGGRPRGQSSYGNNWKNNDNDPKYGRNQFRDNSDDFRGFGGLLGPPTSGGNSRPSGNFNSKRQQNPWLNFCREFQRGSCPFSDDCRLLHVSQRDETQYANSGDIPANVVEQAMSKSMVMDWAYIGNQPHCKDYLQGSCNMRGCNLRHLNTDQYVVEVLAALREKFMIPHDEMFQVSPHGKKQDDGRYGREQQDRHGNGQFRMGQEGMQQSDAYNNRLGSKNDFEPDAKRRRSDSRSNDPLDDLRQQNIKITETNKKVKQTAELLELRNDELRKALRLALDLNSHARNLQEFRGHLREIQSTLSKRGYGPINPDAGSWNEPMEQPYPRNSRDESRMEGNRRSNFRDYDNGGSNSGRYNASW